MEYIINKGVDKSIELYGLKNQYVFIVGAGLITIFLITAVLFIANVSFFYILSFIAITVGTLACGSIWLSKHMGVNGVTKLIATFQAHQFFTNRVFCKLLLTTIKNNSNDSYRQNNNF